MARRTLPVVPARADVPLSTRIAQGLHKIGLALKHETWVQANEEGLSPTQGQILAILGAGGDGDGVRPSEIASRLGVTLPTVSDAVRALVDKGLVERGRDPDDARATRLRLTATGRSRAVRATGWTELLASSVDTLSDDERQVFLKGLVKIIRELQVTGRIPVVRMCVTCTHFRPHVHAGAAPHHCAFVDAAFGDHQLRLDCADHAPADDDAAGAAWRSFVAPPR